MLSRSGMLFQHSTVSSSGTASRSGTVSHTARYPTRRGIPRGTVPPHGTARTCIRQQHVRLVDGRRNGRFRRGAHALDILRSGVRASGQDEAALRRIHRTSAHRKAGAVDTAAAKAWTSGGEKAAAGGADEISRYS